ncbi:uncharacterized protein LOC143855976 [Tasmannia lanceolata]|uniref:uncharacterized protein LOC143855976 n=1 Tax=Tasmannia lanceolata TaxID=3420 RepID=UPI0040633A10
MPFGLKNARATYQRLVNKLFREQIGRNMEVYVDDMLVKSQSVKDHVSDLKETFQVLKEHNMKLNLTKCSFGVGAEKFLGFMVSQRGIEANLEKIKTVVKLTPPKTIREVQQLTGMIAALGRFVSKSAERCLPFFNPVKGIKTAPWTPECQVAFEELKQYLCSPPLLTKPELREELLLYLSTGSPQAGHLRATCEVGVELSEFDIQYLPRPAIKAQVLADFVAECTIPRQSIAPEAVQTPVVEEITTPWEREGVETEPVRTESIHTPAEQNPTSDEPLWEVYVDGSSNKTGCGAGLVLIWPENFVLDYALRFGFRASNNEAEYEALIAGMNLVAQTRAKRLKAYCDSQLVTNQIQGVYEARDERMIKYLSKVRQLASKFKSFEVARIPRTENAKADMLSKLAASGYTGLGNICMEFLKKSSIDNEAVEIMQVEREPCWMDEITITCVVGSFLKERRKPEK